MEDVNDLNDLHSQRGSIMLETVIFLALVSFLFMMVTGQLVFMARTSQKEDARVQGLMAARIKVEELRSGWPGDAFSDKYEETGYEAEFSLAYYFEDVNMLSHGKYTVQKQEDALYKVVIRIYDKKNSEVYSTQTTVWVEP